MFTCDDASLWQYVALGWVNTAMPGRVHAQLPEGVSRELPHSALTLWTVSLGVDHGSGSSKHGTAGPRDRNSHLLGKSGRQGKGQHQQRQEPSGEPLLLSGKTGKSQP